MVLTPVEPWVAERHRPAISMSHIVSLDRGAPVSRPGLMFEKSSDRATGYR
jgi:hypothetical protein